MLDLTVLNTELANGLYKKPLIEVAKSFQYESLAPEVRAVIIAGWARGGLLSEPVVEAMIPDMRSDSSSIRTQ
jgi:hypothetical protein